MNSQVIFKIDKKLKDQAMKKAHYEGIAFASVLKLATRAFVAGNLAIGLVGSEEFNATTKKEISGALKDVAKGKNLSPRFSSAAEAARYLSA